MFKALWDLGYTRLVPIIPPDAEISEKSSIASRMRAGDDSRGKTPGVRGADGRWRGISLVSMESRESDLAAWEAMGAGVGIKLGEGLVALDIDTTHAESARKLYELAARLLGPAHVRFGNRPKCLMLYEAPLDAGYRQLRFETPSEPWLDDKQARGGARVEVLTEGRQFVAHGIHPKTGAPYAWPNGIPRRDKLSPVTAEQIDAFMAAAAEELGGSIVQRAERADTPDQERLRAPDWETLARTVNAVPNSSALFPSRDDYVKMAYAIAAAAPDGFELEARDLYLDWCGRWEDGDNDMDVALKDWERAKPPYRTGYGFLVAHAPGLFFENAAPDTPAGEAAAQDVDMFAANADASRNLYDLMSLDDLETMQPPEFLIDRYIPEHGFGILFGAPGSKKSFIALDMALSLAYGLPDWHGDPVLQREGRGGVLYIAGEGASGFQARVAAWKHGRLLPDGKAPDIKFLFQPVNFMRVEDILRLKETVKDHHPGPLSLIVVDTVSRSIPGADENLQKDMTVFVSACDALRAATGAFVLGIHHASKAGEMRGSTVFLGQADVVLRTGTKKGSPIVSLHCEKMKEAPDGWHDTYRMDVVDLGDERTSLKPERVDATDVEARRLTQEQQQAVLDAMQAAWEAGTPWAAAAQAKERYAPRKIAQMLGMPAEDATGYLDLWAMQGLIDVAVRDAGSKLKGYRVLGRLDETQEGREGVFG